MTEYVVQYNIVARTIEDNRIVLQECQKRFAQSKIRTYGTTCFAQEEYFFSALIIVYNEEQVSDLVDKLIEELLIHYPDNIYFEYEWRY